MAAYQYIYVMKGLTKIYPGGRKVLENIWLSFLPGAKIGVLGLNGSGKSTLLRIMAGHDNDFAGEAWAAEGATVGFLSQEPALDPGKDVLVISVDGQKSALEAIQKGEMNATVECNPRFGPIAFDTLEKFLRGEDVPAKLIIPDRFFDHASQSSLRKQAGLTIEHAVEAARAVARQPATVASN